MMKLTSVPDKGGSNTNLRVAHRHAQIVVKESQGFIKVHQALQMWLVELGLNSSAGDESTVWQQGDGNEGMVFRAALNGITSGHGAMQEVAIKMVPLPIDEAGFAIENNQPVNGQKPYDVLAGISADQQNHDSRLVHFFGSGNLPDGERFEVMELVHGPNGRELFVEIDRLAAAGSISLPESIWYKTMLTARYLEAVEQAAQNKMDCIDPRPDNCMLDVHTQNVICVDSGSFVPEGETAFSIGQPDFAAPESINGRASTARTVYAFGNMLCSCLMNRMGNEWTINNRMMRSALPGRDADTGTTHSFRQMFEKIDEWMQERDDCPDDVQKCLEDRAEALGELDACGRDLDAQFDTDVFSRLAGLAARMASLDPKDRPSLADVKENLCAQGGILEDFHGIKALPGDTDSRLAAIALGSRKTLEPANVMMRLNGKGAEIEITEGGGINVLPYEREDKVRAESIDGQDVRIIGAANILAEYGVNEPESQHWGEVINQYRRLYLRETVERSLRKLSPDLPHRIVDSADDEDPVLYVPKGVDFYVSESLGGIIHVAPADSGDDLQNPSATEHFLAISKQVNGISSRNHSHAVSVLPALGNPIQAVVYIPGEKIEQMSAQIAQEIASPIGVRKMPRGIYALKRTEYVAAHIRKHCGPEVPFQVIPVIGNPDAPPEEKVGVVVLVAPEFQAAISSAIESGTTEWNWPEKPVTFTVDADGNHDPGFGMSGFVPAGPQAQDRSSHIHNYPQPNHRMPWERIHRHLEMPSINKTPNRPR